MNIWKNIGLQKEARTVKINDVSSLPPKGTTKAKIKRGYIRNLTLPGFTNLQISNKNEIGSAIHQAKAAYFAFLAKLWAQCSRLSFSEEGFDEWKNARNGQIRHEESTVHKKAIVALLARKKKGERVDYVLVKQRKSE